MSNKLSKSQLKAMRADIDKALESVRVKYNLDELHAGNATYSLEGSFSFKLEGLVSGGLSSEALAYQQNAKWMGLPELGATFINRGEKFEIVGLRTRAKKFPILCKSLRDGRFVAFSDDDVKMLVKSQNFK